MFRHLPLPDVHPDAMLAAEAAQAAGAQGAFWEMQDRLFAHQDQLDPEGLFARAAALGLDLECFLSDLGTAAHAARVRADVASAQESGDEPWYLECPRLAGSASAWRTPRRSCSRASRRCQIPTASSRRLTAGSDCDPRAVRRAETDRCGRAAVPGR